MSFQNSSGHVKEDIQTVALWTKKNEGVDMLQDKTDKDDLNWLWKSFLSGRDDAFSKIYERLVRELYSLGTTLTADGELVKDCIQDVFIRLYKNRAQLASVRNIKVYLLIALKNALIDAFRKQRVYQKFIDSYEVKEEIDDSEEERMIAQESETAVQHVIAKYTSSLSKRQQEIIHYRFVEELSIEEIANLLNVSYQTVANTIQQSLKKIRKIFLKP